MRRLGKAQKEWHRGAGKVIGAWIWRRNPSWGGAQYKREITVKIRADLILEAKRPPVSTIWQGKGLAEQWGPGQVARDWRVLRRQWDRLSLGGTGRRWRNGSWLSYCWWTCWSVGFLLLLLLMGVIQSLDMGKGRKPDSHRIWGWDQGPWRLQGQLHH